MSAMSYLRMIREAVRDFLDDHALRLGAAISYYAILSLAPLLLLVLSLVGLIFGREAVGRQLVAEMRNMVGEQGAEIATTVISHADKPQESVVAMIVGIVMLIVGAIAVFVQLQDALNIIWEAEPKASGGLKAFLFKRLLSFGMVLGIGFLLLVSLVVSAGLAAVNSYFEGRLPGAAWIWQAVHLLISVGLVTVLFAMIFKFLPDVRIEWREVWLGALITALLFTVGKFAIGLYLGRSSVGSAYGAAGSLVVLLVWIYYSSLILFFGAEFTQVYAHHRGRRFNAEGG